MPDWKGRSLMMILMCQLGQSIVPGYLMLLSWAVGSSSSLCLWFQTCSVRVEPVPFTHHVMWCDTHHQPLRFPIGFILCSKPLFTDFVLSIHFVPGPRTYPASVQCSVPRAATAFVCCPCIEMAVSVPSQSLTHNLLCNSNSTHWQWEQTPPTHLLLCGSHVSKHQSFTAEILSASVTISKYLISLGKSKTYVKGHSDKPTKDASI